jgi:hypothetical protein
MKTLSLNELTGICGGLDPLTDSLPMTGIWWLQDMDQLAREQEAAFLRGMIMECVD